MEKDIITICPICFKRIKGKLIEKDNKVYVIKKCEEHGEFKDIYFGDYETYKKFSKYYFTNKVKSPITKIEKGCPFDCGLCPNHKSESVLVNIDVTNRCNLNCPICFANANKTGKVYEPSFEKIKEMMINLRKLGVPYLQFAGGEPTVRDDIFELIKLAKDLGFLNIQLATNGIKLKDKEYVKKLLDAGLNTIYLQFDGLSEKPYLIARGKNLFPIKDKVIKNCREVGFNGVVLVPTLVKNVNDNEVGDIIKYAVDNFDVVRGINFQPVSFVGRVDEEVRLKGRITIPDFIKLVEEQTNGEILKDDFYPVSIEYPISKFVSKLINKDKVAISCHPCCGVATYIFVEDGKIIPITRFLDVEGFIEFINENIENLDSKVNKLKVLGELLIKIKRFIDFEKAPKCLNMREMLNLLVNTLKGDYSAAVKLHHKMLMIGCMHFMDGYNFDIDRVSRCVIHYALPDGKIIPFCSYNLLYREMYENKYSIPIEEWKNAKRM
ncbi:tetraether lipid synthase Tes [Methanocaldococcus indicus]|uniref:tetraether lipid synthase Tes n=1 Tax=Methanocaldococcus indicus TaxID=213231 RepID=UPI003C6D127B